MLRLATQIRLFSAPLLNNFVPKYSCSSSISDPKLEHIAEISIRQHRRLHLNMSVLNQNKDVMFADLRKSTDGVIALKQKGKCPGVIKRASGKEEDDIDVILEGKKMRKLSKHRSYGVDPLYIRVEGQQIMCIIEKVQIHSDGFIQKVQLKEYLPGHPNRIRVPIELTHVTQNPYIRNANEFEWKTDDVQIICYNKEYPRRFYIDVSFCCPQRPYRIGDLANTFPPGVILDPKVSLNDKILDIKYTSMLGNNQMKDEMIKQIVESNKKKQKVVPATPAAATTPAK